MANRLRFLLKKINNDDDARRVQRLKEYWLFTMTYAGAPTLYYGDEMAVQARRRVGPTATWQDDPYNRAPFPWDDTGRRIHAPIPKRCRFLRALTTSHVRVTAPLQYGDVQHGLVISDAEKVYAYASYARGSIRGSPR